MNLKSKWQMRETEALPHFIIVGAMKAGTTTLKSHLQNHCKIHIHNNELHFFDSDKQFQKGLKWYREQLSAGKTEHTNVTGEKTPTYSYKPIVAKRIRDCCPSVKLLWIFRDPVKRAYSNYLHSVRAGHEKLSFREAIDEETSRIKKSIFFGYKERSLYCNQVERYLEFFPKEQMHFMLFEDLVKPWSQDHILNDLFFFLGVDTKRFTWKDEHSHKTRMPRFPLLNYYATRWNLKSIYTLKRILYRVNFRGQPYGYKKMPAGLRRELMDFFRPYNSRLENLTGLDVNEWYLRNCPMADI